MLKRLCFFFLIFSLIVPTISANEPAANLMQKLGPLVKNVNLPGDAYKSFIFDLQMNSGPFQFLIQFRFQSPDNYAMNVFDGADHTPVLIVRGKRALINDPLQEEISLIASAGVVFDLSPQGDQFNAHFAFNLPAENQINNRIKLDFASLFSRVDREIFAVTASDTSVEAGGTTEQNGRCSSVFLPSAAIPLQKLQMFVEGIPGPVLNFTHIAADHHIASDVFVFPLEALESSGIKLVETSPDGMLDSMMVVASVMKAVFTRIAIRSPELRREVETRLQMQPDWAGIEATDRSRAEKLREIFQPFKY